MSNRGSLEAGLQPWDAARSRAIQFSYSVTILLREAVPSSAGSKPARTRIDATSGLRASSVMSGVMLGVSNAGRHSADTSAAIKLSGTRCQSAAQPWPTANVTLSRYRSSRERSSIVEGNRGGIRKDLGSPLRVVKDYAEMALEQALRI